MAKTAPHRIALLVGVEDYEHIAGLRTPYQDVRLLSGALEDLGFLVHRLADGDGPKTAHALRASLAEFRGQILALPEAGPNQPTPCALFYFAGHGVMARGRSHLLTEDVKDLSVAGIRSGSVDLFEVMEELSERLDVPKVLMIDACQVLNVSAALVPEPMQMLSPRGNMLFHFATQPGEVALEDGHHSPYAVAVSKVFPSFAGSIGDALGEVRRLVRNETHNRQCPVPFGALDTPLSLRLASEAPPPAGPLDHLGAPPSGRTMSSILGDAARLRSRQKWRDLSAAHIAANLHRAFRLAWRDEDGRRVVAVVFLDEGAENDFVEAAARPRPDFQISDYGAVLVREYGDQLSLQSIESLSRTYGEAIVKRLKPPAERLPANSEP